jgi:hypothetical protein
LGRVGANKHLHNIAKKWLQNNIKNASILEIVKVINTLLPHLNFDLTEKIFKQLVESPKLLITDLTNHKLVLNFIKRTSVEIGNSPIAGIYIFTHKITNDKYVGSSSNLLSRLHGYFLHTHKSNGKFLPLLYSSPISD